jgi:hypothetical protein
MPLPESIQTFIDRQVQAAPGDYEDLRAVIFNGTLKRSPEPSNTDGMLAIVRRILQGAGVRVDEVRTIDHDIPAGCRRICESMAWTVTSSQRSTGISWYRQTSS